MEQSVPSLGTQRNCILHPTGDCNSIPKEQEQQIQHDAEADEEVERALAEVEGFAGERLARLPEQRRV